jgi:hypothetical protein
MAKAGVYNVPGTRPLGSEPKADEKTRPTLAEDKFVLCMPRANDALPLRQPVLDEWLSVQAGSR